MTDGSGGLRHCITGIAVAKQRSAAISSEGKLFTWGRESGNGALGWAKEKQEKKTRFGWGSDASMCKVPEEVLVFSQPNSKAQQVVFGATHTLVLTQDHQVYAFGDDSKGQCGLGKLEAKNDPTLIDFGDNIEVCWIGHISRLVYMALRLGTGWFSLLLGGCKK